MPKATIPPVVVQNHTSYVEVMWAPFNDKVKELNGAPGTAITSPLPEKFGNGSRVRYQDGTIYQRADGNCAWVHGAIGDRYDQLGAATGWLGMPVSDEVPFPDNGRASKFENGAIYWWSDTGAIEIREVIVHYTGLYAFAETDWDQGSTEDEPYVILGVVSPSLSTTIQSQIYSDVDSGDSRPDVVELYRGQPEGISISVLLMEHDDGDPTKYRAVIDDAVKKGTDKVADATKAAGSSGPFLAAIIKEVMTEIGPWLVDLINKTLDTGDDKLGSTVLSLTAKEMVVLAARTSMSDQYGIGWKTETENLTGDGSDYRVYFNLVTT